MRKLTGTIVAALMTFAGVGAVASTPAQAATGVEYVALGDSYASGVGAAPYDSSSGDCLRSPNNYPHLWAATHSAYTLTDATCSGATIADVENGQLSALSSSTGLVSVTVGGNDAQFATVLEACLSQSDSYCETATSWMSYYATHEMVTDLTGLYNDIHTRAPKALVLDFGYPELLSMTGTCNVIDLDSAKRTAMNGLADALAEGTLAASTAAGVYYIDMRSQFSGHGACGSDPWINGVDLSETTASFHPNATGYEQGYAAKFSATWS
ncbi:SGNH/GDSL hydrolase family protein [Streptomyces fuscichromogenes]|uniref:SGNH/GDSL hydrolase family protein n=1 Tax=Streptomyces fuscichromogenes TaxID=1324013 RepID=UPI0037FEA5CF